MWCLQELPEFSICEAYTNCNLKGGVDTQHSALRCSNRMSVPPNSKCESIEKDAFLRFFWNRCCQNWWWFDFTSEMCSSHWKLGKFYSMLVHLSPTIQRLINYWRRMHKYAIRREEADIRGASLRENCLRTGRTSIVSMLGYSNKTKILQAQLQKKRIIATDNTWFHA